MKNWGDLVKYIYICNAVPELVNNALNQSVAGNKFSLNMGIALDKQLNGELMFLTVGTIDEENLKICSNEIWPTKKIVQIKRGKRFVIKDLVLRNNLKKRLKEIRSSFPKEEITIIIENAPFAVATACKQLKKKLNFSCYSCVIDTPFVAFSNKGLKGKINAYLFNSGIRALKNFDGIISFTEDVMKELKVKARFLPFAIGCNKEDLPKKDFKPQISSQKDAVYAGTLIYYNGIEQLLNAYKLLGEEYKLHIYGYGPLEEMVERAEQENSNIFYHGRFNPEETNKILGKYELLINPRLIDKSIENFTFPSKLIDYMLTGKSVLTSNFKTMPNEYKKFLYVLDNMKEQTIAEGVRRIFEDDVLTREQRGLQAIEYIKEHQLYDKISEKIIKFCEEK